MNFREFLSQGQAKPETEDISTDISTNTDADTDATDPDTSNVDDENDDLE